MAVLLMTAIITIITIPRLQTHIASREIDAIARRFVMHANFARNQALHLGASFRLHPRDDEQWEGGWLVSSGCVGKIAKVDCQAKDWFIQEAIYPIYVKKRSFQDPHSRQSGILFNPAGAAKSGQGGFVANRLILGHRNYSELERHLILSSGGRWRICNPRTDSKGCQ